MKTTLDNGFSKIIDRAIKAQASITWDDIVKGREELQKIEEKSGFRSNEYNSHLLKSKLDASLENWDNLDFASIAKRAVLIAINTENVAFNFIRKGGAVRVEADGPNVCFQVFNKEFETFGKAFNVCELESNFSKSGEKLKRFFEKANIA